MKKQPFQQEYDPQNQSSNQINKQKIPKFVNLKIVFQEPSYSLGATNNASSTNTKQTIELIEQFPLSDHVDPQTCHLSLKLILYKLSAEYNISFENKEIHYFLEEEELYMNCGIEPISEDVKINPRDFLDNKEGIRIKVKKMKNIAILHKLMAVQNPIQNEEEKEKETKEQNNVKSRRTKERRIGYIIEKVIEWRKHYHGNDMPGNQHEKLSLDEAAHKVNISKKSLDDYLFQIRFGHKFHFNFNEHYNDKVGVLRDFVRSKKNADKQMKTKIEKQKN